MKRRSQLIYIASSLVVCGCFALFLRFLAAPVLYEVFHVDGRQMDPLVNPPWNSIEYYQIDPATIIADIKNGQKDVFRLFEDMSVIPEHASGSFPWSSEEYFTIAQAHHLYLTGEPVDDEWKIFAPGDFEIDQCRDEMKGFDKATIIFYKSESKSFPVTYMEIEPLRELISSAVTDYVRVNHESPWERFFDNPDSHFEEAKAIQGEISAEDALQIAEEAGGKEMRQQLSNDGCRIRVVYFVDKWVVWYYWRTQDLGFTLDFEINSDNGSYKIERDLDRCERTICP